MAVRVVAVCFAMTASAWAQTEMLPAPPATTVEAGVPTFVVLSPEAMGVKGAPTDFFRLPDGRYVAVAPGQIAMGDGVRWDVFDQSIDDVGGDMETLMFDAAGTLYAGLGDAIGRIEINENGQWWRHRVANLAPSAESRSPSLAVATFVAGDWYWYGYSGGIARWEAGNTLRSLGSVNAISRVFAAGGRVYLSDSANGRLYRIERDSLVQVLADVTVSPDFAITGSATYDERRTLVSTVNQGLLLFDGESLEPAPRPPMLGGGRRIADLCLLSRGTFAAAVQNQGLVIFDRNGRVLQVLDRTNDHRLSHVRRLVRGDGGELWVLLNGGVARVAALSPVSYLEPLVADGFSFALPVRHRGRLWLCADGQGLRGEYDEQDRLLRFVPDSPPGRYVYQLMSDEEGGRLLASTDGGLEVHDGRGWSHAAATPRGMHLLTPASGGGRWFYCAPGEIGWIRRTGGGYTVEPVAVPGLGDSFGGVCDRHDVVWLELGTGKCGRVDLRAPRLELIVYGPADGLKNSWIQLSLLRGEARVTVAGEILRFVESERRFVPDDAFDRRFPSLKANVGGRAIYDTNGRLWIMANAAVQVFDDTGDLPRALDLPNLHGLRPYYFIPQGDGVVWMHRNNFLVRYDPTAPVAPVPPLRALISSVQLPADNRTLLPGDARLAEIPFASNTLAVRYAAVGSMLGAPVVFETMLEGAGQDWVPAGNGGTALFNRLKEGRYILHVRPRLGAVTGEPAQLAFTVRPPWYRSTVAYVGYGIAALGLVAFIAWLGSYLESREKVRLERLVAQRTLELNESNLHLKDQIRETMKKAAELQASEERYRHLTEELEARVASRTEELAASNRELEAFSYSVSHDLRAPLRNISGFAELLHKQLLAHLNPTHAHYLELVAEESVRLGRLIDSLLSFSRLSRAELNHAPCDLDRIVRAVREELQPSLADRAIEWRIGTLPMIHGDPTLIRQVFANLIGNAVKFTRKTPAAVIEVAARPAAEDAGEQVVYVRDNGAGFDPQYSQKLFGVFQRLHRVAEFEGTGIGLANVRRIVLRHGGRVWAEGQVGAGATFYVAFPVRPPGTGGAAVTRRDGSRT